MKKCLFYLTTILLVLYVSLYVYAKFDNNIGITITINDNEIEIDRRCDEYEIVIVASLLETKKGIYKIKGLGNLDLDVKTKKLEINENGFEVNYLMILDSDNPQEFKYTVTYRE